jgi:predicted metal-dependent enzyme (double-stranded beta helix superfamily)
MFAAAETFIAGMRQDFADGLPEPDRWERCRTLLKELIADPEVKEAAKDWPVTGFNPKTDRVQNLLFYEDPDYGFVINGLIKNAGGSAMVHDHGTAWTIYGVLSGEERIVHFDADEKDDGKFDIKESHAEICGPGDVDIVQPWLIHSEYAQEEKSIAVIVRSQRSGTFLQYRYLDDGSKVEFGGPEQVPYSLG